MYRNAHHLQLFICKSTCQKHYNVHDQVYEKTPKAPIHCHEAQGPIYKISYDLS